MMVQVFAQTVGSLAVGSMASLPGNGVQQSRCLSGKTFLSGTSLPIRRRVNIRGGGKRTMVKLITSQLVEDEKLRSSKSVAAGVVSLSTAWMLANAGAAQAISRTDVDEAYTKVEVFTTQVTTTASSFYETAKSLFDQVFATVKPGLDVAVPYVQQTTQTVTKFAAPLASDLADEAQKALKNAGLDTQPGVEFAKQAAQQTSKVLEGAQPLGSSVYESALAADPVFLVEAAGGLVLFYFLAPVLVSAIANSTRGYAGDLAAAQALDLLINQDYSLIDIRTEKEKNKSGIPSLPSNAKNKYLAIPLEELPAKVKSQVRNSGNVEAEIVGIKISALKKLGKGSKIVVLDDTGVLAKTVARVLRKLGFKNSYVINDGFKGGRGWVQSRLGSEDYSSGGISISEVLSPSRIIPAGTKRVGSAFGASRPRLNLLPGGFDE